MKVKTEISTGMSGHERLYQEGKMTSPSVRPNWKTDAEKDDNWDNLRTHAHSLEKHSYIMKVINIIIFSRKSARYTSIEIKLKQRK